MQAAGGDDRPGGISDGLERLPLPYVFTIAAKDKWPLVVGVVSLKSSGEAVSSWNLMLAGISISILPMLIVYLFLNKYFISGLTEGSVKG